MNEYEYVRHIRVNETGKGKKEKGVWVGEEGFKGQDECESVRKSIRASEER